MQLRPSAAVTGTVSAPVGVATGSPVGIPAAATASATLSPGSTNGGRSSTTFAAYVPDDASTRQTYDVVPRRSTGTTWTGAARRHPPRSSRRRETSSTQADGGPSRRCLLGFSAPSTGSVFAQ